MCVSVSMSVSVSVSVSMYVSVSVSVSVCDVSMLAYLPECLVMTADFCQLRGQ